MKKLLLPFVLLAMVILVGGCSSSKKVAYFQNIDTISLAASRGLYDARIMPKDMLTITVITTNPAASAPFNLTVSNTVGTSGQLSNSGTGSLQGYMATLVSPLSARFTLPG
jgi:polysaccharide biosynthesis/export protein